MPPAFMARSAALLVLAGLEAELVADPEAAFPGALDAAASVLAVGTAAVPVAAPVAATGFVVVEGYWLA